MISGLWEKLGFWNKELINTWKSKQNWIWFHAVSVGELNAIWPLIQSVYKLKPKYPIMISTTTSTGYSQAKNLTKNTNFIVFYFPFDFPHIIKKLLRYAQIKLLVIAETEIWPTVLTKCQEQKIPTVLVNARLSDKSFKNYMAFKFFFKNIVNKFTKIITQSQSDTEKFLQLGTEKIRVLTLANIKFASIPKNQNSHTPIEIDSNNTKKIVFASTHQGEEEIALNTYKEILKSHKNIRLIIAPRHIDRAKDICSLITKKGFIPKLRTLNQKIESTNDIYVLNTIGELNDFYKISKVAIIGGTFAKIGGHNILEPVACGLDTIIGPYDFKITELSNIFKNKHAITQVDHPDDLAANIMDILNNQQISQNRVKIGQEIIKKNENILEKITEQITPHL